MPNRHQRTIADVCQTDVEGSSVGPLPASSASKLPLRS